MSTKPMIGSYKNPKELTPAQNLVEGVQGEIKDSMDAAAPVTELAQSYETVLASKKITIAKAHSIVDSMLEKGFYEEVMPVTKAVTVTFRTRTHNDYIRYLRALEMFNPKFAEEQAELQLRYFLAASLVAFKGVVLKHVPANADPDAVASAFDSRLEWIEKQPERVINLLATKLSKFDDMIHTVMSEGVVENF